MKKIAFSLIACLSIASSAFAGHQMASGKDYKGAAAVPCFQDQELQLDVFGLYGWTTDGPHDDGFGGGIGISYFFMRNLGVGIDGSIRDADDDNLWTVSANLIVRFPIEGSVCVAPYALVGGGIQGNDGTEAEVHAGGGLEFRLNPGLGIFTEGRYYWGEDIEQIGRAHV